MNELIEVIANEIDEDTGDVVENIYSLDKEVSKKIADFEKAIKEMKEKEDELKAAILEEMQKKNIIKIDTEELIITKIAPTTRETLDTKLLKEELPDIYDSYVKISEVKASLRIKLR